MKKMYTFCASCAILYNTEKRRRIKNAVDVNVAGGGKSPQTEEKCADMPRGGKCSRGCFSRMFFAFDDIRRGKGFLGNTAASVRCGGRFFGNAAASVYCGGRFFGNTAASVHCGGRFFQDTAVSVRCGGWFFQERGGGRASAGGICRAAENVRQTALTVGEKCTESSKSHAQANLSLRRGVAPEKRRGVLRCIIT